MSRRRNNESRQKNGHVTNNHQRNKEEKSSYFDVLTRHCTVDICTVDAAWGIDALTQEKMCPELQFSLYLVPPPLL